MPPTDTSETGLETLIMLHLTGVDGLAAVPDWTAAEPPAEETEGVAVKTENLPDEAEEQAIRSPTEGL